MTHGVHVVLQVTFAIIGEHDAAQFSIPGKMESGVRGEDEEASDVPPADLLFAHGHLHDGVKASLGRVQVSRNLLLTDQPVELVTLVGQLQDILVAEGAGAVLVARARVLVARRSGADVWHDSLLHE